MIFWAMNGKGEYIPIDLLDIFTFLDTTEIPTFLKAPDEDIEEAMDYVRGLMLVSSGKQPKINTINPGETRILSPFIFITEGLMKVTDILEVGYVKVLHYILPHEKLAQNRIKL